MKIVKPETIHNRCANLIERFATLPLLYADAVERFTEADAAYKEAKRLFDDAEWEYTRLLRGAGNGVWEQMMIDLRKDVVRLENELNHKAEKADTWKYRVVELADECNDVFYRCI